MTRPRFAVPSDGNCLLWSVVMAHLLPVIHNDEDFRNRFKKLFGSKWISIFNRVQKLLQESTCGLHANYSNCYQDSKLKLLVSLTFRDRIIETLRLPEVKSECLKTITLDDFHESHNDQYITSGRILTELKAHFKTTSNFNCSQLTYQEIVTRVEDILKSVDSAEKNEFLYEFYLKCMTENTSSWAGHHEILAISHMLQCEVYVATDNKQLQVKWNDSEYKIYLFYNGSHYGFEFEIENSVIQRRNNCASEPENISTFWHQPAQKQQKMTSSKDEVNKQNPGYPFIKFTEDNAPRGSSLVHGSMYQVKLMFLFLKRAQALKLNFRIAAEYKETDKFDNMVFLFQNGYKENSGLFLQAKHKNDENVKITYEDLIGRGNEKFSLKKHFISNIKLLKYNPELSNVKLETFIIFTNIGFHSKLRDSDILKKIKRNNPMLDFKLAAKTSTRYHLNPDEKMKEVLRESSQVLQLAKELVDHVFCNPPKLLTLKTPMFKIFHQALCAHVIDKDSMKFREQFVSGKKIPVQTQQFRHIFNILVLQRKTLEVQNYDKNNLIRDICEQKITLTIGFGCENEISGTPDFESKNQLLPDDVVSEKDIEDFFNKLVFAVDQPNEVELGQVIEREMGSSFHFSCSKDIAKQVKSDLLNWFKHEKANVISPKIADEFFKSSLNVMNLRVGIGLGLKDKTKLHANSKVLQFQNLDAISRLLENDRCYLIKSDEPLLTVIKIYQCIIKHKIYKTEDSHIFIDLSSLLEVKIQNYMFNVLEALNSNQLVVIHCRCTDKELLGKSTTVQSLCDEVFESLKKKNKKLLVVVRNESELLATIWKKYPVENDETKFNKLSLHCQNKLLDKGITFQGNDTQLRKLSRNKSDLNVILDGKVIADLIMAEKKLEIGIAPLKLSQSEAAYAKRLKPVEPKHLLNAFKLNAPKEAEKEIFLFTESMAHNENYLINFTQLFNINVDIDISQLRNCVNIFDASKSDADYCDNNNYYNCKKINILLNEKEDRNLEVYKKFCYFNPKKFVYWLEIENGQFNWQQVYDPGFYIKRYFITKKIIKREDILYSILKNKCVISSKIMNEISSELDSQIINQGEDSHMQNVFVYESGAETNKKFNELCADFSSSSVHMFRSREEECDNSLIKVGEYVDYTQIDEECVVMGDERVVVLVAEPGMGKSTTLTNLSEYKLKNNWVFRLNLRDHQEQILNLPHDYGLLPHRTHINKLIVPFLLCVSQAKVNQLTLKFLTYCLNNDTERSLLILFDGYDEISDNCKKQLMLLMNYLKENTYAKLWISSRNECTKDLEQNLGVFSTTFKELSYERNEYLRNFYQVRLKLQLSASDYELIFRPETGKFDLFLKALLRKVDKVLNKTILKFMGIPLQMRLLAEGFLPEFESFIDSSSTDDKVPDFKNLDVLHFYQRFIKVKYDIYFREKTRLAMGLNKDTEIWLSNDLNKMHQKIALKILFPYRITNLIQPPFKNFHLELRRVGILQVVNPFEEKLEFIHRTFAEYFVAQFILKKLRENFHTQLSQAIQKLLLNILQEYHVICMFLNEQITDMDLSQVKFGYFDKSLFEFEGNNKQYKKLIDFTLTFFNNKIWILKELDFNKCLHRGLRSQNSFKTVDFLLKFTNNHYDVVRKNILKNPKFLSDAVADSRNNKKSSFAKIMNAIKCYPKIIEEVTRDYYLEDLCELLENDEVFCQFVRKLKGGNDGDISGMTLYEVKANKLLRSFAKEYSEGTKWKMSKEFKCLQHFEDEIVNSKPYKMRKGRDLENLVDKIEDILKLDEVLKRAFMQWSPRELNKAQDEEGRGTLKQLLIQYDSLNQKLKLIKRENERAVQDDKVDEEYILRNAFDLVKNKKYDEAKKTLKSLARIPKAYLWFNDRYNKYTFEKLLNYAIKNKKKTIFQPLHSVINKRLLSFVLFLFNWFKNEPIICMHLFSIVSYDHPEYTRNLIDSVQFGDMKELLSHLLISLNTGLNHDSVKKFGKDLLNAITENKNYKELRDIMVIIEHNNADGITKWMTDKLSTNSSFKILKQCLRFLVEHGESTLYKAIEQGDLSFITNLMNCLKKLPKLLHFLIFNANYYKFEYYSKINEEMFHFIFEFVWNSFPKTACCWAILADGFLCTPLSRALEKNYTTVLKLLFDILNPYPTILKHLILTPNPESKSCLHYAILKSERTTLEVFLTQLNRNKDVMKYVINHFVADEEDKLNLYEAAGTNKLGSLLFILNSLKAHANVFRQFFVPSERLVKPAFYLAAERGCKEVIDVLLRALKSEGDVLWELLIWTDPVAGKTVLHRVAERGYREIADALLSSVRKQKDKLQMLFSIKDTAGHTALNCAVLSEVQIIRNKFNVALREQFIDKLHSIYYTNCENNYEKELLKLSPDLKNIPMVIHLMLILAKNYDDVELILAMFENEELRIALENMNVTRNGYSYNLYYSAIQRNCLKLVDQLIGKGINVNATNGFGYTPLMKAVKNRKKEIIESLLNAGADIYVMNMNGESAYCMAMATDCRILHHYFGNK